MRAITQATGTRKIIQLVSVAGVSIVSLGLSALLLGLRRFKRLIRRDVEVLLTQATRTQEDLIVTEEMLQDLPGPVRRYLTYSGVVGKPFVSTVHLK